MLVENNDIFIALWTLMLQPATEVETSLTESYLNDEHFLRKGRTVKENLT